MTKASERTKELARHLANGWVILRLYGSKQYSVVNDPSADMQCHPAYNRVGKKTAAQALTIAAELGATFKVQMLSAHNSFLVYLGKNEDVSALDSLEDDIAPFSEIKQIVCIKPRTQA